MFITDTHCHITCDELYGRIEEIITNALEHNVKRMLIICCTKIEYERALNIQNKYPHLFDIAFGFYPHQVNDFNEEDYIYLEEQIKQNKLIAIGEIGLDYYWDNVSKEDQMVAFKRQMDLASKYQIPILIHNREATADVIEVLKAYPDVIGVFHCFSGSLETAKIVTKLGYYISFAGPLTFKNARSALEVAANIDLKYMFVETDSPYLTPHPYRGKRNEPKYVALTFEKLCEIKNISKEEAMLQLEKNYQKMFKNH